MIQSSDPVLRAHSKNVRNGLTDQLNQRGMATGVPYAIVTNDLYSRVLGASARDLRRRYGIGKRDSIRDAMPPEDLALIVFAESKIAACLTDPSVTVTAAVNHVGSTLATLSERCEMA